MIAKLLTDPRRQGHAVDAGRGAEVERIHVLLRETTPQLQTICGPILQGGS